MQCVLLSSHACQLTWLRMYHILTACKTTVVALDYKGYMNTTVTGHDCQPWNQDFPHNHSSWDPRTVDPDNFPDTSLDEASNYCRNPTKDPRGPWCFTSDPIIQWEYCPLPRCGMLHHISRKLYDLISRPTVLYYITAD